MRSSLYASLVLLGGLASAKRPNILFILTDDQDNHMNTLDHMNAVRKHIKDEGTTFTNHYCTTALCCPSRGSIWTGRMAHNTNVTDVRPPHGGYAKIVEQGINDDYLPIWMQDAGYNTYYVGKLWNAYGMDSVKDTPAKGFTKSDILVDPRTYRYFDAAMSHNGGKPQSYKGQYSTDVIASLASRYLDEAMKSEKPWMLVAAPVAPHCQIVPGKPGGPKKHTAPPPPAPRHEDSIPDYKIPRSENFNPEEVTYGASWVKFLPQLTDEVLDYNDHFQRRRIQSLLSVDDMVEDLVAQLTEAGELDNTYIIFSSDNGYHISQHRMNPGKQCAYETDINVPFIVRGPGVAKGVESDLISSHTDIAPTFMWIANQDLRDDFDGHVMPLTRERIASGNHRHEHTQAEYWGSAHIEGQYNNLPRIKKDHGKHTYKAMRLVGQDYSLFYAVWCTNERELYDMKNDPHQMYNLFQYENGVRSAAFSIRARPFHQIAERLDALTMVLKSCKGLDCRDPWGHLHPHGRVTSLTDALDPIYDEFYADQPKVSFSKCPKAYFREDEGPQMAFVDGESANARQKKIDIDHAAGHPKRPGYFGSAALDSHDELRRRALEDAESEENDDLDKRDMEEQVMNDWEVYDYDTEYDPYDDDIGTFVDGDWAWET